MTDNTDILGHLDGARFCMVRMTVLDEKLQKASLLPIHGTAKVLPDRLLVVESSGTEHVVPDSAIPSILPSDGTEILKDADHFVIVKIGTI